MIVGVLVGGRGSRLGGVSKGLLAAPSGNATLVERLRAEVQAAFTQPELVLVGAAEPYAKLGLSAVPDAPEGVGPLGGLGGLLAHAERRGASAVLALACDLPYLERGLLARLGREAPEARALVVTDGAVRNPLIARYAVTETAGAVQHVLAAGRRSLQAVLDELGSEVVTLELSEAERATLRDWDTPEDIARGAH